jgi:RNA polymerase sigma factor (sigma-70 family)
MNLKQLLRRLFPNLIPLPSPTVRDLKALYAQTGVPLELVCDRILQEHVQDRLRQRQAPALLRTLPPRVREVAVLYCQGFTLKEIGEHLNISPDTVGVHIRTAVAMLGLHSRSKLRKALESVAYEL